MDSLSVNRVDTIDLHFINRFNKYDQLLSMLVSLLCNENSISKNHSLNKSSESADTFTSESDPRVLEHNNWIRFLRIESTPTLYQLLNDYFLTFAPFGSILDFGQLKT